MQGGLKRIAIVVASALLLTLALKTWAVPSESGAAHLFLWRKSQGQAYTREKGLPFPARFRHEEGRGLLVNAWINGSGPYRLAIDTGAGATLISDRVAREARVEPASGRTITIGGLSGKGAGTGREARLRTLAIGDRNNYLPSQSTIIIARGLPEDVDGVLDPTESFWPLGYVIDFPGGTIAAFDPRLTPLRMGEQPAGGAVVPWITEGRTRRPFVRLDNGRSALIDTGSGFGLALNSAEAERLNVGPPGGGRSRKDVRDLGGGSVSAHRIAPLTIRIGSMALRNVPTDLIYGVESGAPILLGREALYPFKLSFDPLNRLISIRPARPS